MLSHCVDDMQRGMPGRQDGHTLDELSKAIGFLARMNDPSSSAEDLLLASPYRTVELLLILYFSYRQAVKGGAPSDMHRVRMLLVIELLTLERRGLLHETMMARLPIKRFNLPLTARVLQRIATLLLSGCSDDAAEVSIPIRAVRPLIFWCVISRLPVMITMRLVCDLSSSCDDTIRVIRTLSSVVAYAVLLSLIFWW